MNKEDIIRMAREAWKQTGENWVVPHWFDERAVSFERFAALVAEHATAEEREQCAKLCEEDAFVDQWKGLTEAAKRIRARGNT